MIELMNSSNSKTRSTTIDKENVQEVTLHLQSLKSKMELLLELVEVQHKSLSIKWCNSSCKQVSLLAYMELLSNQHQPLTLQA